MALSRAETEARCGFSIPDEIWQFTPWGNRLLVRREPPEERFGRIIIPDSSRRQISAGTIVKVGSGVGELNGLPGQALIPSRFIRTGWVGTEGSDPDIVVDAPCPDLLIGLVVTFGHWTGEAIRPASQHSAVGDTYDTEFVLIQAVDIWGDNSPEAEPKAPPSDSEENTVHGDLPTSEV